MRKNNKDERITAMKHKLGYQAFGIMYILTCIAFVIVAIMDRSFIEMIALLILITIPGIYYEFRKVRAGIYTFSSNEKGLKKAKKKATLYTILSTVIVLIIIGIDNSDEFQGTTYIVGTIIMGIIFYLITYKLESYLIKKSYKKSNEMIESDDIEG